MKHYLISCIILILLTSCAHVISRENREIAVKDLPFKRILDNPEVYINNVFILGGIIAKTTNTEEGTEIEIVQTPLDRFGNIIDRDISGGRFLIITSRQLDPLIYRNGRNITVAGRLIGTRKRLHGDLEYNYPIFEAKEIHLWKKKRYYLYQPYYPYPYWYGSFYFSYPYYWDPFWPRPYFYPYPGL